MTISGIVLAHEVGHYLGLEHIACLEADEVEGIDFPVILFNRDFIGPNAVKKLTQRKALLGIVALRFEEDKSYSTSLLLLTSPAYQANGFNILIHKTGGALAFGGTALVVGDRAAFSIRAVARPGSVPIKIRGRIEDSKLEFERAMFANVARQTRHPVKGLKPVS